MRTNHANNMMSTRILALVKESHASDKVIEDVHRVVDEADMSLVLVTVQREESLLIMQSLDDDIAHCCAIKLAEWRNAGFFLLLSSISLFVYNICY